ncbi:glycosyltransferase family 1 protein [Pontibacter diazotrophicus]|uniref:Glycosyltransferase family 1 protein n=1 Tax=Pontibacter diazotrophicus TaxID=1400979 RepID=A0A3D8LGZ1_9BACT|nr:glycosyltransferase family 4 protein [Pontibacter diazotrophicus]RDV16703.1 glycosyltransferase family 1 protein [Pontibacter diazotrophicus]
MSVKGKIRVLETIRQGKIGGGETHVLDLVKALDKELYEPIVLSFTDGPMISTLQQMGIKTYVIKTERPFDFTKWKEVKRLLKACQIDILHAHGTRALSNTFWAARRLGLPIIYTVHGWSFHADQPSLMKSYRTLGEKFLTSKSDITVCVSESNLKESQQLFDMSRATIIKNGIDLNKFNKGNSFSDIRRELNIAKETILVGYIARITSQKDPITLLKAIALIPADVNIHFLIVGEGDLKEEALQLAVELKILTRVTFVDFRQDIPDILNAIDIYCLPSLWEGLSIGLLEAMAMSKAIVATAIDGTKEVIEHMVNGLLVPPSSPALLAKSLTLLATDEALRNTLSANAHLTIKDNHDVRKMTRQIESLYQKMLPQSRNISSEKPLQLI